MQIINSYRQPVPDWISQDWGSGWIFLSKDSSSKIVFVTCSNSYWILIFQDKSTLKLLWFYLWNAVFVCDHPDNVVQRKQGVAFDLGVHIFPLGT